MNYNEFIEKLKKNNININDKDATIWIDDIAEKFFIKGNSATPRFDFIIEHWEIGGVSGGSCWEASDPQEYKTSNRNPKTFKDLDAILTLICPEITYLQYKKVEPLIAYDYATNYEYYGNRTDYSYRYVDVLQLYNLLEIKK